jgi:hypothetical protein
MRLDPADELFTQLLYLAWQNHGHYKNIEKAWGELLAESEVRS